MTDDEYLEDAVENELIRQRAQKIAKEQLRTEELGITDDGELLPLVPVGELDDSPVRYRVDRMMPWFGTVMISAAAKTGKSTLVWNLLRALVRKEEFLGRETTYDGGRIAYLAFEMEEGDIKTYAKDAGLDGHEVMVARLKGKAARFAILDPRGRSQLAAELADVEVLVLDPLGPLLAAMRLDENSSGDVSRFREACEALISEAGISLLLIVHHTGHGNQGRARGSSVLMDWPDALWSYRRGPSDDSPRELTIDGRKVGGQFRINETSPQSGRICLEDSAQDTLEILRRVWNRKQGLSFNKLHSEALAEGYHSKNKSTFRNELEALHAKELISRTREGQSDIYGLRFTDL